MGWAREGINSGGSLSGHLLGLKGHRETLEGFSQRVWWVTGTFCLVGLSFTTVGSWVGPDLVIFPFYCDQEIMGRYNLKLCLGEDLK